MGGWDLVWFGFFLLSSSLIWVDQIWWVSDLSRFTPEEYGILIQMGPRQHRVAGAMIPVDVILLQHHGAVEGLKSLEEP